MPHRSAEDLQAFLHVERAWRRKEISTAFVVAEKSGVGERETLFRAFWLLQYAHWEGFVKIAAENYLYFVAAKNMSFDNLKINFRLLPNTPLQSAITKIRKNEPDQLIAMTSLFNIGDKRFTKKFVDVSTEGNLRFKVLKKFSAITAVDFHSFVEEAYLDKILADRRNDIAHGRWIKIDENDATELRDRCSTWMDSILNNLVNSAVRDLYRK